jgi:hypothetical protein
MNHELSALRKQVVDLNQERLEAINHVLGTKPYIAAQVYERYKKCGSPNCKCMQGELHGPFLWVYQRKKGQKAVSTTITKGKALEARELSGRYKQLLNLRQKIREVDHQINVLLNKLESHLEKEVAVYVERKGKTGA